MDRLHGELSADRLIDPADDDATTVQDFDIEASDDSEVTRNVTIEHCECGSISCRSRQLQLPASARTIFESWTIVLRRPSRRSTRWTRLVGCIVGQTTESGPGKVVAVTPKIHFEQQHLAQIVLGSKSQYNLRPLKRREYDEDLEHRLRKLDETVQDELFSLLRDRTESASNPYRRREYKLAVLLEVPGGGMTDAGSRLQDKKPRREWLRKRTRTEAALVEYRVILRGHVIKTNDAGWAVYDRFSEPWRLADEADLASTREKMGYQALLD